jgi:CubicO group peptidase (beta-lactamase class C family)
MNRPLKTFLIVFIVFSGTYFLLPDFLVPTLIYQHPGITDYKIFNNRRVEKGEPQPWPMASNYNRVSPSEAYADTLKEFESIAFLVIHHDSLLYESYEDPFSASSLSNSFSMAKSIVGLLVGYAIEEGSINGLDDKVLTYLPELKGTFAKDLTIRHLLSMSSGSSWDESYSSIFSMTTQAYYGRDLGKTIEQIEIINPPGETFSYRSGDTQLVSEIVTRATGKTLAGYASEKLWKPLGAEQAALWSLDKANGREKAYCCFNSNARDFARLGALVLNQGQWHDQQLLSDDYIREIIRPVTQLTDQHGNAVDFYGLQWWIMHYKGLEIPYARGILGQYIFILPEEDAVIVRLGHERSKNRRNNHTLDAYTWVDLGLMMISQNQ